MGDSLTPVCVDPTLIDQFWPHVKSFIDMAFWSGRGDDDSSSVYKDLKQQFALLWIVWDDEEKHITAAVITKILNVPRGKVCLIAACAGNKMNKWLHFLDVIEQYARAEECEFIRFSGRRGWVHHFRGWREPWVTLEKEL